MSLINRDVTLLQENNQRQRGVTKRSCSHPKYDCFIPLTPQKCTGSYFLFLLQNLILDSSTFRNLFIVQCDVQQVAPFPPQP